MVKTEKQIRAELEAEMDDRIAKAVDAALAKAVMVEHAVSGDVKLPTGWNTSKQAIYRALETWKKTGKVEDEKKANLMAHQYRDYMYVVQMKEYPKSITFNPVIHKSEIFKVNGFGGA